MKLDKNAKNFNVSYFDSKNGFFDEVGLDGFERCDGGLYNVTFTVNHFSLYAIEPIYQDDSEGMGDVFILISLIIAIVLVCLILIRFFDVRGASE